MRFGDRWQTTLSEIRSVLQGVDAQEVEQLLEVISKADRVFVTGVGRMALMSRAFVMRLMHLGLRAYMVGDITTPAIGGDDLLLANSGSGCTSVVLDTVRKARAHGARIAACTAHKDSPIGQLADVVVCMPVSTKAHGPNEQPTAQPMGNQAEQSLLILLDVLCWMLVDRLGATEEEMWARHANLE